MADLRLEALPHDRRTRLGKRSVIVPAVYSTQCRPAERAGCETEDRFRPEENGNEKVDHLAIAGGGFHGAEDNRAGGRKVAMGVWVGLVVAAFMRPLASPAEAGHYKPDTTPGPAL